MNLFDFSTKQEFYLPELELIVHGRYIRFLGFNLIFPQQLFINLLTFFIFHFFIFTFYTLCTFCSIKIFSFQWQGLLSYFFLVFQNKMLKCVQTFHIVVFLRTKTFWRKAFQIILMSAVFYFSFIKLFVTNILETLSDISLKLKIINVIFFLKRIKIEWMILTLTFLRYNYNKIPQAND